MSKEFHYDNYREWIKDPFTMALFERMKEDRSNAERALLNYTMDPIEMSKYIGRINSFDTLLSLGYPELSGDDEFNIEG